MSCGAKNQCYCKAPKNCNDNNYKKRDWIDASSLFMVAAQLINFALAKLIFNALQCV